MAQDDDRWRVAAGEPVDLSAIDTREPAGAPGGKRETNAATAELNERLARLQERLYAESRRSVLVVLQALDAGGKDGTVKHVFRGVNPAGVAVTSFKAPSSEELAHDFLWRVHLRAPERGHIGVFNRSHYEDVLVVRVEDLVPEEVWRPRYESIRGFERTLVQEGTTVVKLYLHISREEQAERFQARLDDPEKHWKFNEDDLTVRDRWSAYREAYTEAIEETCTEEAPWYVVPADRKWYRNWAVSTILVSTLERMDPRFPDAPDGLDEVTID